MDYSVRGTIVTVQTSNRAGTVTVTRTSDDSPLASFTIAEACDLAPALSRALELAASNPAPEPTTPHPDILA